MTYLPQRSSPSLILDLYRSAKKEVRQKFFGIAPLRYPLQFHNHLFSRTSVYYLFQGRIARTLVRELLLAPVHAWFRFSRVLNTPILRMGAVQMGAMELEYLERLFPTPEIQNERNQDIERLLSPLDGPLEKQLAYQAYCLGARTVFRIANSESPSSNPKNAYPINISSVEEFKAVVCGCVTLRSDAIRIFKAAGLPESDQLWPQSAQEDTL